MPIANTHAVSVAKTSTRLLPQNNIGKKLANPYTVANMQRALANLTTKGDVNKVANLITASHYYIKFMPKNEAEFSLLKLDSTLILYPFPLDVKLNKNINNSYREPGLAVGVPTYQYASVTVNYKLPKVAYQILADLYLPNERSPKSKVAENGLKRLNAPEVTVQSLVNEAESIACEPYPVEYRNGVAQRLALPPGDCDDETGDGGDYGGGSSGGGGNSCGAPAGEWRPSGRITMTDDVLGLIGVEGLKIRARRWFTTYTGITNANGDYCVDGTYTRPANYWFDFERYDFSVNDHGGGPQYVNGPKIQSPWNYELTGYNRFCGTIFRAAYHYYYNDIQGLIRPPQNSFWATQVKIGAWEGTYENNTSLYRVGIFGELIKIYTNPGQNQTSAELYATTIHELAHAVHWQIFNPTMSGGTIISGYSAVDNKIAESWATGVQYALTKMVYPNYAGRFCANGTDYKNVVLDMIDLYDGSYLNPFYLHYGFGQSKDLVDGYSILQVQNALINETSWNGWRDNIKNLYNNGTEQNLDALFNNWYNW